MMNTAVVFFNGGGSREGGGFDFEEAGCIRREQQQM